MISIKQTKRTFLDKIPLTVRTVLDIGCSKGYLSKRFSKEGALVVGVDKREQEMSQENFTFVQEDIRNFEFSKYDLIINSLVLHFFDSEVAEEIIKKMQNSTNEEGFNLLILMSKEDKMRLEDKFYPSIEKIKELYSKWKLVASQQDKTEKELNSKEEEHSHNMLFCLFQKQK